MFYLGKTKDKAISFAKGLFNSFMISPIRRARVWRFIAGYQALRKERGLRIPDMD
jgi:hypothetical protein